MTVGRKEVLTLYRTMLKEASKFEHYNYRNYTLRRIKESFRANSQVKDAKEINSLYESGLNNYQVIYRQVGVSKLYPAPKTVMEQ